MTQLWTQLFPRGYIMLLWLNFLLSLLYDTTYMYMYMYVVLSLQVKHERLKLLQHPLISRYITHKWWKVVFFLFLLFILVYILFLIFLTSFTVNLPRPGPDDEFCKFVERMYYLFCLYNALSVIHVHNFKM